MNTYANQGAPLMKLYPPADLLHRPFKKIADFKISKPTTTKLNKQREYQQICAVQRLFTKIKISQLQLYYLLILELQSLSCKAATLHHQRLRS